MAATTLTHWKEATIRLIASIKFLIERSFLLGKYLCGLSVGSKSMERGVKEHNPLVLVNF